jgi:NAD(P)-dependent dehydrogenase (short-subunit alcohol dehydrogenase family)
VVYDFHRLCCLRKIAHSWAILSSRAVDLTSGAENREFTGLLDVVINNVGYGNLSSVEDTPLSEFRAQIETNFFGTIIVTKAASFPMHLGGAGYLKAWAKCDIPPRHHNNGEGRGGVPRARRKTRTSDLIFDAC